MGDFLLTKTRIQAGVYEGLLESLGSKTDIPRLEMHHLGALVGTVQVVADTTKDGVWAVSVDIPASLLTDGVQAFSIIESTSKDTLDSFTILTGEPLEDDIRAEVALLRAELDMLKKAFRRHCVETLG